MCVCVPLTLPQSEREATLSSFRSGKLRVLIATDVAARGLDIPEVDLVIHVGPPTTTEAFVHRSGRTARAGRKGTNVIVVAPKSSEHFDTLGELEKVRAPACLCMFCVCACVRVCVCVCVCVPA